MRHRVPIATAIVLVMVAWQPRSVGTRAVAERETAAVAAMRTIHEAQATYYSQFNRYATSLAELGPLASGVADGYRFTLTGSADTYAIRASPVAHGTSGGRSFYSDRTMAIHVRRGPGPATPQDPEMR